jgi:hypothetical protein
MAKVVAPLLSMGASGQIGKSQVYAVWKGVKYARRYTIPSNPQSAAQTETRSVFFWGTQVWKLAPAVAQAPWTAAAKGKPLTNRNLFLRDIVKKLRGEATTADMVGSPGNGGGLAPTSIAVAVASLAFTVTLGEPALPAGWTITGGTAWAIPEQDPATAALYDSVATLNTGAPTTPVVDVPTVATYRVFGWFQFTKPDGTIVYGPSISTTALST